MFAGGIRERAVWRAGKFGHAGDLSNGDTVLQITSGADFRDTELDQAEEDDEALHEPRHMRKTRRPSTRPADSFMQKS